MILERHVVSLSSSLKTDKSGLYVLARVCERLIEGKPITAGELWYGDTPELSSLLSDRGIFKDAFTSLLALKQASQVLTQLQLSLDMKLRELQKPIAKAAHHYGIKDLPDELLSSILSAVVENVAQAWDGFDTIFRRVNSLASVNRRFRDVVYGTARCWSNVNFGSKDIKRSIMDIFAGRSRNTPLKLRWHMDGDAECPSLDLLRRLSVRCKFLDIYFESNPNSSTLMSLREPAVFPNLVTLKSRCYDRPTDAERRSMEESLSHWSLPNLRRLSTAGCIIIPTTKLSQLTSLELKGVKRDIRNMRCAIREAISLEQLKLEVAFVDEMDNNGAQEHVATINLAKLRTFEIKLSFKACGSSDLLLDSFTDDAVSVTMGLRMPKLESMSFCVEDDLYYGEDEEDHDHDWMFSFLSFLELFPIDESEHPKMAPVEVFLSLIHQDAVTPARIQGELVSKCLSRFPSVQSLTFSSYPYTDDALQYCIPKLAKLRHLCIGGSYIGSIGALEELFTILFKRPAINLETITLSDVEEGTMELMDRLPFAFTKGDTRILYQRCPWG